MARIIRTLADGSQPSTFLNQSRIGVPLQTGVIRELQSGVLYGYSGMINFDVTAAASYSMLNFSLNRDSFFKMTFAYDGDVADTFNAGVGVIVNCDGQDIFRAVNDRRLLMNPITEIPLTIPANKETLISVLNPNATAALILANVTLMGEYI